MNELGKVFRAHKVYAYAQRKRRKQAKNKRYGMAKTTIVPELVKVLVHV